MLVDREMPPVGGKFVDRAGVHPVQYRACDDGERRRSEPKRNVPDPVGRLDR